MYSTDMTPIQGIRRSTARERICAILGQLADQNPGQEIKITGDQLAVLADVNRENASRVIAQLRREGVLERRPGYRLAVVDREALR